MAPSGRGEWAKLVPIPEADLQRALALCGGAGSTVCPASWLIPDEPEARQAAEQAAQILSCALTLNCASQDVALAAMFPDPRSERVSAMAAAISTGRVPLIITGVPRVGEAA